MSADPFDLARAEIMLIGYSARWFDAPYRVLAVEAEFDGALINPESGAESRTFRLGGKIDAIVEDLRTGRTLVVEHKTSSEDVSAGSPYWKRLRLNAQISTYLVGARALGYDPAGVLYDVLAKPGQRPSQVPVLDESGVKIVRDAVGQRVRTKDGKKWRESASSAEGYVLDTRPETVDEYRTRVANAVAEDPARYFVRGDVVRLEAEERESAFDAWQTAALIREGRNAGRYPRNPDACVRYGSTCTFFGVCTGEAALDDATRYRRVENVHSELAVDRKGRLPLLTNSEMSAARACDRLHHYAYDLGYRAVDDVETQRFGTLVHLGLERWFIARQARASESECVELAIDAMRTPQPRPIAKTRVDEQKEKQRVSL